MLKCEIEYSSKNQEQNNLQTFKRPNASAKTGGQTGGQTTIEQVYSLIKNTPTITRAQLMELTGKSSNTIQKCILKLKQDNRIKRIGSPTN